jgi:alkylated DNA nucleotide flippase Atl1
VNKQGGLAGAFPGGRSEQARRLEAEGVKVNSDYQIKIKELLWNPQH